MKEVVEATLGKEEEEANTNTSKGKKKVSLEDMIPDLDQPILDDRDLEGESGKVQANGTSTHLVEVCARRD